VFLQANTGDKRKKKINRPDEPLLTGRFPEN